MEKQTIILIAKQFFKKTFSNKGLLALWLLFLLVLVYTTYTNWQGFYQQRHIAKHHQEKSRESWENNPDKHPHRMAHFGSFVFRESHGLSVFDSGIEHYTGNVIFLEAHKQNTANFSKASVATGLSRFGDLNTAMLLQMIVPLVIFFLGYASIVIEKQNGTLKIVHLQGASVTAIFLGKILGLFAISALFFIPAFASLWSLVFMADTFDAMVFRCIVITISYTLFYFILSGITILLSAKSKSTHTALLTLLGVWLVCFVLLPKAAPVVGNLWHPNISKIGFKAAVAQRVLDKGNSHNPKDPAFNALKDSVLQANNVTEITQLPFNYSGFLMRRGEKQTAIAYNKEYKKLIATYAKQNSLANTIALCNPYMAIKHISMAFCATDFNTYISFLSQVEHYRYAQSQYMNNLQMQFISNKAKGSAGHKHVVKKQYWKKAPVFTYNYIPIITTIKAQLLALVSILFWFCFIFFMVIKQAHRFKIF